MGYSKDAIKGISWMGALRVFTRILSLVRIAILARILSPAQFGIFGIAALVLSLVEILTETGINVFLIQEKDSVHRYINTAWIISIVRGIIICLLIALTAPFVAKFFEAPDAYTAVLLISTVPLIRGFINPSIVRFQKELTFDKEFGFRSIVFFIDAATAIVVGIFTHSAESLVWGFIGAGIAEVVLSHVFISPRPVLKLDVDLAKKIISRGKWITAAGIFNYIFQNGDNIIVGKILGTGPLGIYQQAYKIATLTATEGGEVLSRVTFPLYVKIGGDRVRLARAFYRITGILTLLVVPLGIIFFAFPKEITLLLLGPKWLEAVPVLRVLGILGVVRALTGSATALFFAVGKQEYVTVVTLVSIVGLGGTIIPLIHRYDIVGAGIAALFGAVLSAPFVIYYVWKIFKENPSSQVAPR